MLGHLNQLMHPFQLPHHLSGTPGSLAKVSTETGGMQEEECVWRSIYNYA